MSKHKVVLTTQDREELAPLLNITKAERELMPKEILEKLELLAKRINSKLICYHWFV